MSKIKLFLKICILSLAGLGATFGFASDKLNHRAVVETAKKMSISVERVREDAIDGCSGSQFSMNVCATYHYVVEDLNLNDLYSQAIAKVRSTPAEPLLRKSQKAWLIYRDASCEYESQGVEGGSMHGAYALECMKNLTSERAQHLEKYVKCTSAGCPGNN